MPTTSSLLAARRRSQLVALRIAAKHRAASATRRCLQLLLRRLGALLVFEPPQPVLRVRLRSSERDPDGARAFLGLLCWGDRQLPPTPPAPYSLGGHHAQYWFTHVSRAGSRLAMRHGAST